MPLTRAFCRPCLLVELVFWCLRHVRGCGNGFIPNLDLPTTDHESHLGVAATAKPPSLGDQISVCFGPTRIFLWCIGRFPFQRAKRVKDLVYPLRRWRKWPPVPAKPAQYTVQLASFHYAYFLVTTVFLVASFLLLTMGFAKGYLDWDMEKTILYPNFTKCEQELFDENLIPFVLTWSCLLNSIVGSVSFVLHRKRFIRYFNDWERLVVSMEICLPDRLRCFLAISSVWWLTFLAFICVFFWLQWLKVAVGGPKLIALLLLKPFISSPLKGTHSVFHHIGLFTSVYSLYCARVFLFIFAFECRLLVYCFETWTSRLKAVLEEKQPGRNDISQENECAVLFHEYRLLVEKVRETSYLFGAILQSYYATQILNMCFELYYLARSSMLPGDGRENIIASLLMLIQNVCIFLTVSVDGAKVQSTAARGLRYVKFRGRRRNDQIAHRQLIENLHCTFSERISVTGDGFFAVDKPFILKVLGAVCTYFVIILQFGDKITK